MTGNWNLLFVASEVEKNIFLNATDCSNYG